MTVRAGTDFARQLRAHHTPAERKLWSQLRGRALDGFKFRRQFPIDRYVVDFVCIDAKLVIELDGSQHRDQVEYDAERTRALEANGYHVLRFWNGDVLRAPDYVLGIVYRALHRDF